MRWLNVYKLNKLLLRDCKQVSYRISRKLFVRLKNIYHLMFVSGSTTPNAISYFSRCLDFLARDVTLRQGCIVRSMPTIQRRKTQRDRDIDSNEWP